MRFFKSLQYAKVFIIGPNCTRVRTLIEWFMFFELLITEVGSSMGFNSVEADVQIGFSLSFKRNNLKRLHLLD